MNHQEEDLSEKVKNVLMYLGSSDTPMAHGTYKLMMLLMDLFAFEPTVQCTINRIWYLKSSFGEGSLKGLLGPGHITF